MYKPTLTKKPETKTAASVPPFVTTADYRARICAGARIGKKGYTIPKELLDPADLQFLYQDLYMIPTKQGPTYGAPGDTDHQAFPIYRENSKKIYLPRFYALERYGRPTQCDALGTPIRIACPFDKPLRDYQETVVSTYLNHVRAAGSQGGIITIPCGAGKCLAKDTPILMYDGTIKLVQDVVVGDRLMGDDSTPRTVLTLARGRETMYRVRSHEADVDYTVNASHILTLVAPGSTQLAEMSDIPVRVALDILGQVRGLRVPVEFAPMPLHLDGLSNVYTVGKDWASKNLALMSLGRTPRSCDPLPHQYKCHTRETRLQLLAGILDAVGFAGYGDTATNGRYVTRKYVTRRYVTDDVIFLARSLGIVVRRNQDGEVVLTGPRLSDIPVRILPRATAPAPVHGDPVSEFTETYPITLDLLPEDDYYGFEIDGNRRFVLGDFTVTHNTVMSIKIIASLAVKTLIIVHKEFLLNQWVERIREFMPSARIGRIQSTVFDSKGKDIVIGMLQTLYDRDFPEDAFDDFGLTVVDEVHRIGSCQFSRALLRIQTPYMLGVTATLERKDGLTKVIHYFMGPTVYADKQGLQSDDGSVLVRGMEFVSRDPEFNEVVTDFRGNTQVSTMITKLCNHGPRTRFLVDILRGLVTETPEAQILVLGHNRSLLVDLHDAIVDLEIATTGYYLGGMKPAALEATTEKQIILATYAMAAEGFDHKNLSILVMVTPKTDIVQSVGRIFRQKHARPLIVDVIDTHDTFKNQWARRRTYYKKCGFRIHHCLSTDPLTWKTVYEPRGSSGATRVPEDSGSGSGNTGSGGTCLIPLDAFAHADDHCIL